MITTYLFLESFRAAIQTLKVLDVLVFVAVIKLDVQVVCESKGDLSDSWRLCEALGYRSVIGRSYFPVKCLRAPKSKAMGYSQCSADTLTKAFAR